MGCTPLNLKEDSAISLVLQLHQFLNVFPLLMRLEKKIFGNDLQSHMTVIKVVRHGRVDKGSIELQDDVVVDGSLQVRVVVLVHLAGGRHDAWLRTGSFVVLEQWQWPWGGPRVL